MDLNDLSKLASDQDAGHTFELFNPTTGEPIGMKITLAGPDSDKARQARFRMEREITKLQARKNGLTPQARDDLTGGYLFEVTLAWDITEAGKALPFTRENFVRLLNAGTWVRAQIDTFAGDRSPYFDKDEEPAAPKKGSAD